MAGKWYKWRWNSVALSGSPYKTGYGPYWNYLEFNDVQKGDAWETGDPEPFAGGVLVRNMSELLPYPYDTVKGSIEFTWGEPFDGDDYSTENLHHATVKDADGVAMVSGNLIPLDGWTWVSNQIHSSGRYTGGRFYVDMHFRGFVEDLYWARLYVLRLDRVRPIRLANLSDWDYPATWRYTRKRDNSRLLIKQLPIRPSEFAERHGPPLEPSNQDFFYERYIR